MPVHPANNVEVLDEGVSQGFVRGIDFTGGEVTATVSGSRATVNIPTVSAPVGADPTAQIGLVTINGVATTFMRSDAAPPLDQTIAPTWTGIHTFRTRTLVDSNAVGVGALSRLMIGLELTATGMNGASATFTPAVKFMSRDPDFATENPKFLAAIVGRATETYNVDAAGGMAIEVFVTRDLPGANSVPVLHSRFTQTGHFRIPADNAEIQIGVGTTADVNGVPDLRIWHDAIDTRIRNNTGNLIFSASATEGARQDTTGKWTFAQDLVIGTQPVLQRYAPSLMLMGA